MELLAVPQPRGGGGLRRHFFHFQNFGFFFGLAGTLSLQGERGLCLFILKDQASLRNDSYLPTEKS